MNTEHYKKVLLNKQRELQEEIARFKGEVREAPDGVEDPVDEATTSQSKATALEENSFASETLVQVEDALRRIEEDTYGYCVDCGRAIEPARLDAVPWTPYCLEDQQKHDNQSRAATGSTI
jgi:DnaK suppressor protein